MNILAYLRNLRAGDDQLYLDFYKFYENFPFSKIDSSLIENPKDQFKKILINKDYNTFKAFRDKMLSIMRKRGNDQKVEDENLMTFYILDFFFSLIYEPNKAELIPKLKKFFIEYDNQQLCNFTLLLLRTI